MSTLNQKIKLYLENNSKNYDDELENYVLQNDLKTPPTGKVKLNNDYLVSWNVDGLDAPTQSDIDALWLNLAIVILKNKSVIVGNDKTFCNRHNTSPYINFFS